MPVEQLDRWRSKSILPVWLWVGKRMRNCIELLVDSMQRMDYMLLLLGRRGNTRLFEGSKVAVAAAAADAVDTEAVEAVGVDTAAEI